MVIPYNSNDAHMYLSDTVVRYCGEPIYISRVDEDVVYFSTLQPHQELTTSIRDKDIDISPVPLGYTPHPGEDLYTVRIPGPEYLRVRRYKQGLCFDAVNGWHSGVDLWLDSVYYTIKNIFPSFEEALGFVEKGKDLCAFSRTEAIDRNMNLHHKGMVVGSWKNGGIVLDDRHYYLNEIREMMNAYLR